MLEAMNLGRQALALLRELIDELRLVRAQLAELRQREHATTGGETHGQ